MGIESFQVEIRGDSATFADAVAAVRALPNANPDSGFCPGSEYYTAGERGHVIELEVSLDPVRISCRFTLCHPSSINDAFYHVVHELMARLGMRVLIRDDVPDGAEGEYTLDQFAEFAAAATWSIARRRAEWVAQFGTVTYPARTREAYERFVMPICSPVRAVTPPSPR